MDPDLSQLRATVAFTPSADASLRKALTENQLVELEWHLSENPTDGDVMPGCGGFRKLRWSAQGRGKRGGVRVIYYYVISNFVFVAKAYPKNEKENLTATDKYELKTIAKFLQESHLPRKAEVDHL